jgi:hypothetical protein
MTPTQIFWTFWIIFALITILLGFVLLALISGLRQSATWSMGDALSEEAGNQPNPLPAGQKAIMVASSSRLIAFLGLSVLLCLFLGFGYMILWDHFFNSSKPIDTKTLLTFLFGGATMFAPYVANQVASAFGTFFPSSGSQPAGPPK